MPFKYPPDSSSKLDELRENFKFLWTEIIGQIQTTSDLLKQPGSFFFKKMASRDDYIDNLKTIVENACFSRIHGGEHIDQNEINSLRAIHTISVNLERIADFCVNIARQVEYFSDPAFIQRFDHQPMLKVIETEAMKIHPAFEGRSLSDALEICRSEYRLDILYNKCFRRILQELQQGGAPPDLITSLFIFRYLERIGDSLLNIGEALLFAIMGEKIKIHQFEALQETLSRCGYTDDFSKIKMKSIWGTRSGCRISLIGTKTDNTDNSQGIFKEGNKNKILREKNNLLRWQSFFPGLTPRVFGYHETSETASLLIEFLPGCTFEEVLLSAETEIVQNALFLLQEVIEEIWARSLRLQPVPVQFMKQLLARIDESNRLHPALVRSEKYLGELHIPSTIHLIRQCAEIEATLEAPLSVFCHGDFNVNNIVYDHEAQRIYYIDVYRSHDGDYVEDAAVFLVSLFRLPAFEPILRERLNEMIAEFFGLLLRFSKTHQDTTFQARLALGLCRNFYTSIRFEQHQAFAKEMVLRSHYLMEKIRSHADRNDWGSFSFSEDILFLEAL
ncbi:PhoU domain-containing protein [Desulfatirhabdium butyrativorans]|uniref:PhoU domain-containing protein n=1 Tax=Desulfatirhabdium butyrativorans TaxID=340467 RepID=UPI0004081BD6|nr:PhoU domain-containing protein [Desulfatirhabdium butyrativorans]